jgi:DNA (cytosine-5)-methyltransferase 1
MLIRIFGIIFQIFIGVQNVDNTQKFVRHLSLCTGYGGIDIGLKQVLPNCRTIAYCEIETFAIQNLVEKIEAGQMDEAPIWSNLETFPFKEFRGCVDILSGGIPCQPFSNAGLKAGIEDERHLYPFIAEGIKQCRPSILFFENVEGMFSTYTEENEVVLHHVLKDLESMGYTVTAGLFSASEIGAPHQRKRVFIMGFAQHFRLDERTVTRGNGKTVRHAQEGKDTTIEFKRTSQLSNSSDIRCGGGISSGKHQRNRSVLSDKQQGRKLVSQTKGCSREPGKQFNKKLSNSSGTRGSAWLSRQKKWEEGFAGKFNNSRSKYPSRPTEPQKDWEEKRVIESVKSKLGGTTNGSASRVDSNQNRIDRLRLLGNGVVPDVSTIAFQTLADELLEI